jgi:hypothetical protein
MHLFEKAKDSGTLIVVEAYMVDDIGKNETNNNLQKLSEEID